MKKATSERIDQTAPSISAGDRARLARVAVMPDESIDLSDSPEVTNWKNAERGRFVRPLKQQITLRIDADVVVYFQQRWPNGGYQTAMNAALRAAMEHDHGALPAASGRRST